MSDEPDYVTVLHRPDGQALVARVRYVSAHDDYEPVRMSRPLAMADAIRTALEWATALNLEYRP